MVSRLAAHGLLVFSVIIAGVAISWVYGGVIKETDADKNTPLLQQRPRVAYRLGGRIESLSFENRVDTNDTVTITVRNIGNIPLRIREITINEERHTVNPYSTYVFDINGNFYISGTVPAGGYGVIKMAATPLDLMPEGHVHDVHMRTTVGSMDESFAVIDSTYPNPPGLEVFTPYILALMFVSFVSVFYYRRFKMLD